MSDPTDGAFSRSLESYQSLQEEQLSIVSPKSSRNVAVTVNTLNSLSAVNKIEVRFALPGRGHSSIAGIVNIDHGVIIPLGSINEIEVSPDKSVTTIRGGAIWRDVYLNLGAIRVQRPLVGSTTLQAFSAGNAGSFQAIIASHVQRSGPIDGLLEVQKGCIVSFLFIGKETQLPAPSREICSYHADFSND